MELYQISYSIVVSFFISFTWLDYLKRVDVFERERTLHIAITFVLGAVIPNLIHVLHASVYKPLGIQESDDVILNFFFFTLGVGLLEEVVKFLTVVLIMRLFRHAINEPLDYVRYICVSALGFAFGENIEYAMAYGERVLMDRAILSVPAHMFFSTFFIYGYIKHKYAGAPSIDIYRYAAISFMGHGIYDFLLDIENQLLGLLLAVLLFLLLVNAFATMLNNCLNNSPFYSPKKSIKSWYLSGRLLTFYIIILTLVFAQLVIMKREDYQAGYLTILVVLRTFVLGVVILRLGRLSIIPGVWQEVNAELPFIIRMSNSGSDSSSMGYFVIKGESQNDYELSLLFQELVKVSPLSERNSYIQYTRTGIMEQKIVLGKNPAYILKVFVDRERKVHKHFILIAKTDGITHSPTNDPIASINSLNSPDNKKLIFHEWVVIRKA